MKKIITLTLVLFLLIRCVNTKGQTTPKDAEKVMVQKWFEGKEWLGGLQLQPHETINEMEFARQYQINKIYWDKAFAFLKTQDLQTLANGKHTIDSDQVFAIVTENPTKEYDSTKWESHQKYVDLHYVISGEEKIAVSPTTKLIVTNPYDASKDVANYSGNGKIYSAVPGVFFLFFPSDGHRPGIASGATKGDKKIVIKIRYTE